MAAVHAAGLVYLEFRLLWEESKSKINSATAVNALVIRHPNLKRATAWFELESAKKEVQRRRAIFQSKKKNGDTGQKAEFPPQWDPARTGPRTVLVRGGAPGLGKKR